MMESPVKERLPVRSLVNLGKISNDDPLVGSEKTIDARTSSNGEITSDDPSVGSEKIMDYRTSIPGRSW